MYLVTVNTDRAWLSLASYPDRAAITCGTVMSQSVQDNLDGEIRHYAGGKVQAEVFSQDDRTVQLTLRHLSLRQRDLVISWRGQITMLRTVDGDVHYLVYFATGYKRLLGAVPDDDTTAEVAFDVDINAVRVSFDEMASND